MNTAIDTSVIVIFSVFILVIGFMFARTGRNLKSFFAGGEAVPWFIGGLSLFMSFFSAGTFVVWGSIAYKYGWVAVTIQWTMCVGGLITGLYLAPKWKAAGNLTAAEFIKERLGDGVQKIYVGIFMLVSLFIKGSVLYSVARLVSSSLDYPLWPITIVLGLLMISYTAVGGLWAVMVTDILQFVVLTAAVLLVIPLAFDATGGMSAFLRKVPDGFFKLVNGEYTWGFMLAFAIYHIFYIGGNWTFVQRYTSVDSTKSASRVAYLFTALYIISPVIWMLPPMIYHTINPGLQGLDAENAYLMVCKYVLPAGLMGLMLTGMYFSTSASANTALNVVAAIFTNDIYKAKLRPDATDQQLMKMARISSWFFGAGMIGLALIVPYIGGIVEFTLSIASVTGGALLAPPLWALFSKKLTGKATLFITLLSLAVNLFTKLLLPVLADIRLDRAQEMLTGVSIPFLLLVIYELSPLQKRSGSPDYFAFIERRNRRRELSRVIHEDEQLALRKQNKFGLNVIAFSLVFISIMLFILSLLAPGPGKWVAAIATLILLLSLIPLRTARKIKKEALLKTVGIISPIITLLLLHPFDSFSQKKVPPDYTVKVVADRPTLFCDPGEKVNYTITVWYKGDTVKEGRIRWRISKDGLEPPLQQGFAEMNNGYATVSGSMNEPGFLQCRADFAPPPGFRASTGRSGVAVDPLKIKPGLPPPADFDEYWDQQRKLLAAIPLNVRITKVQSPVEGVECFDVQADCLGAPMSAYMARPIGAAPKTLPAILLLHGAGVASSRLAVAAQWAKDGFLSLDFNAHGLPNGLPQKYYSDLYRGPYAKYYLKNPVHRDSVFFRGLFIRLMRALDVLTIQPEWDGKRLVANGRSQGGGQAFAAAGLDKRITFFAAQIPAMCDHTGVARGRINGWPKLVPFDSKGNPDPVAMQAVRYFDGANFATRTKASAFVTVGFIDVSCPPSSVYAAYNCLKGKKEIINQYFTGHVVRADADSLVREAVLKNVFGEKGYKKRREKNSSIQFEKSNLQAVARREKMP